MSKVAVKMPDNRYCVDCSGSVTNGHYGTPAEINLTSFVPGATELNDPQKKIIRELKKAVEKGVVQERTGAMMILVDLCETVVIRTYLHEVDLLNLFVSQLRCKDSASVSAYALETCLRYGDMMESIEDKEGIAKRTVGMLRRDSFNNVGPAEGIKIFKDIMSRADLGEKIKIKNCGVTKALSMNKGKSKP